MPSPRRRECTIPQGSSGTGLAQATVNAGDGAVQDTIGSTSAHEPEPSLLSGVVRFRSSHDPAECVGRPARHAVAVPDAGDWCEQTTRKRRWATCPTCP